MLAQDSHLLSGQLPTVSPCHLPWFLPVKARKQVERGEGCSCLACRVWARLLAWGSAEYGGWAWRETYVFTLLASRALFIILGIICFNIIFNSITSPSFLFLTARLRANSFAKQFTHLRMDNSAFIVYSQSCVTINVIHFRTFSSPRKETLYPLAIIPASQTLALGNTNLLSVSIYLPIVDVS